jgi:gliding motility-associated-like protein
MRRLISLLIISTLLSTGLKAQITTAYQIGGFGFTGSTIACYSGPVIINGKGCFNLSNGLSDFTIKYGTFLSACLVPKILNTNVYASNYLSPNADGKNDTWVVKEILGYPNNVVTVFDRAGRVVYSKQGYTNDWNGFYKGSPLNEGTYYYLIRLGNGTAPISGFITIVRNTYN